MSAAVWNVWNTGRSSLFNSLMCYFLYLYVIVICFIIVICVFVRYGCFDMFEVVRDGYLL